MKNNTQIILVEDFYNKLYNVIKSIYFPNVKYSGDSIQCTNCNYGIENFSNGVSNYTNLINLLSRNCNDTKTNINELVSKFVVSFNDFKIN